MKNLRFLLLLFSIAQLLITPTQAQGIARNTAQSVKPDLDDMYVRGLEYLKRSQAPDGSYAGSYGKEPGVVGFVLMSILAHGDDPNSGPYANTIKQCLNFIFANQKADSGYIGSTMYSHGFATLALAEAYGVVNDDRIAPALEKAVKLILSAQKRNRSGAWRYSPDADDADSTVAGCQIVALYAARNAGIAVPDEAFTRAHKYMLSCQSSNGGYGYTGKGGTRETLTAIGTLTLALAKDKKSDSYLRGVSYLKSKLNHVEGHYYYYFLYYMSQASFHAGPELWDPWNERNQRLLKASQMPDGRWPGDQHSDAYATACSLLSLALNYRFLPIYEQ